METNTVEVLKERYRTLIGPIMSVYSIFSDYFGEDRVDLQNCLTEEDFIEKYRDTRDLYSDNVKVFSDLVESCARILVWFPEVTIRNEENDSTVIKDLYVKVLVEGNGSLYGKFSMNRETYSLEQIESDYMHSHCPGIPFSDFSSFKPVCTGSGPINATIANLNSSYDSDLWLLFCSELEDFVQVESIAGVPYRRIKNIRIGDRVRVSTEEEFVIRGKWSSLSVYEMDSVGFMLKDFLKDFLKNNSIPIEFVDSSYSIGMSFLDALTLFSKKFIDWFNRDNNPYRRMYDKSDLFSYGVIDECFIKDNTLYKRRSLVEQSRGTADSIGKKVCDFKGREVVVRVINDSTPENAPILLLNSYIVKDFISAICKVINFKYGRNKNNKAFTGRQTVYL